MKKIFAFLALVLMISIFGCVYAADETPKIEITYAQRDSIYNIYGIIEYTEEGYRVPIEWRSFFADDLYDSSSYISIDEDGYVTRFSASYDPEKFSEDAKKYIEFKSIEPTYELETKGSTTASIEVARGYYLVESPMGPILSLVNADPVGKISEKNNTVPRIDLGVLEGDTYRFDCDAKVGDTLRYKATISLYKGGKDYFILCKPEFANNEYLITIDPDSINFPELDEDYYEIVTTGLDDGTAFRINLSNDYLDTITKETQVEFEFNGKLSENISGKTTKSINRCEIRMFYGIDEYDDELYAIDSAYTYSWTIRAKNYLQKADGTREELEGAHFVLSTTSDINNPTPIKLVKVSYDEDTDGYYYRVATDNDIDTVEEIVIGELGSFMIYGLDRGTYYLIQTEVPDSSISLLKKAVDVSIVPYIYDGLLEYSHNSYSIYNSLISTVLPETGGTGATVLYVVGSIMFVGALIVLITKKRLS